MGKITREGFMEKSGPSSGGIFFNLKNAGASIGFINNHPQNGGYWTRKRHKSFAAKDGNDKRWYTFNCVNQEDGEKKPCPLCLLKEFAEREMADGFRGDTVLISDGTRGRDTVDFTLDELASMKTTAHRGVVSAVAEQIVLPWVSVEPDFTKDDKPIKLFTGTTAILYSYQKMLKEEIDQHGEDDGDPVINPYPIRMTYDDKATTPQDYYDVRRSSKDVEIDEDLQGLIEDDPGDYDIDLDKVTAPGHPTDMLEALEAAWASSEISFDEFVEFYEHRAGKRSSGKSGGKKQRGKSGGKQSDDKKRRGKSGGKKQSRKREPEPEPEEEEMLECPECGGDVPPDATECPGCGCEFELDEEGDDEAGSDDREGTWCETCQAYVEPNRKGRCPECFTELDVL